MKDFFKAASWIAVVILVIIGLLILLYRAVAIVWLTVWVAFFSSLPWWERILVPAAVVAAAVFLFRRYSGTLGDRIPRNKNFVYYTSETREERSSTFPKTEDQ
jgi:hypothetical protein